MLGTMATVLSATIVNVALPDIMAEFGIRQGRAHWLATGFIAAMTTTMLASAWLLDRFGIRRSLGAAMLLFALVSLLGGLAAHDGWLILARVCQGAIAGLMQPMGMFLVFRVFPRERRGTAMGIYGMGVILAPALGPVLGGVLVDQLNWRYVMFAPAPVTLLGAYMVWRFLPTPVDPPKPYPFDLRGFLWLGLFMVTSLDALNRLHGDGPLGWMLVVSASLALLALWQFVRRERRAEHPLLQIRLFRYPAFRYAVLGALALGLALFGSTYLIPLFVQTALGYSATQAGLLMLPAGIALGIVFPLGGRLADQVSARLLIATGLVLFAASAILYALSDIELSLFWLGVWAVLGRIGLGFMMPAMSTAALNPLAPQELGGGSGALNFARQIGGAFGIKLVALTLEYGEQANGYPGLQAFHAAWWLVAVFVLLALWPTLKIRSDRGSS